MGFVIINGKDIKMPESCYECDALGYSDIVGVDCDPTYSDKDRPKYCPLISSEQLGELILDLVLSR